MSNGLRSHPGVRGFRVRAAIPPPSPHLPGLSSDLSSDSPLEPVGQPISISISISICCVVGHLPLGSAMRRSSGCGCGAGGCGGGGAGGGILLFAWYRATRSIRDAGPEVRGNGGVAWLCVEIALAMVADHDVKMVWKQPNKLLKLNVVGGEYRFGTGVLSGEGARDRTASRDRPALDDAARGQDGTGVS